MKRIFGLITIFSILALPVFATSPVNFAGSGTTLNNGHNLTHPVPATDVELVKKITVRGPKGKGKPTGPAATGILGEQVSGEKYAIVIGVSDYPGTVNDLSYADDDAEDMTNVLENIYGFKASNIQAFIDKEGDGAKNATRTNIIRAIENLSETTVSGDEVVFFFSGHGTRGIAADGDKEKIDEAIVVHDGSRTLPIWDGELRMAFENFKTDRIIFFFDSCLAGGMTDLQATGRIINMATTEAGTSYESELLQNGYFTYYFAEEGMLQSKADKYDNISDVPDVTIEEAFDYAKGNISKYLQTPVISDLFTNDLLL